jgi:uncharacterized protein (DUF58 family)
VSAPLRAEAYLAPETLAQLAPFELRARMLVDGLGSGMHASPRQGQAVEFAEHRPYTPGESLRHLDWKVFGRSDKLYLKRYEQETNLDVMILVDASSSMRFGTLGSKSGWGGTDAGRISLQWTKFDCAAAISVALAHLCLEQRDRVGMTVYADDVRATVRRSGAKGQWRSLVQSLATVKIGGVAQPARAIDQVLATLSARSLIFILSDFQHPMEPLREALAKARFRGHDVVLARILDRQEIRFPLEGFRRFEDMEGQSPIEADAEVIRAAYLQELKHFDAELERLARSFNDDVLRLDSHDSVGPPLAALLSRREAAWRARRRG